MNELSLSNQMELLLASNLTMQGIWSTTPLSMLITAGIPSRYGKP